MFLEIQQMSFDYQYIDPGPDDPSSSKNRYFALNVSILQISVLLNYSAFRISLPSIITRWCLVGNTQRGGIINVAGKINVVGENVFFARRYMAPIFPWIDNYWRTTNRDKSV